MGVTQHHTVIATVGYDHDAAAAAADRIRSLIHDASERVEGFDRWQLIGPVDAITNGYVTYALLPDGSKRGWDIADEADRIRDEFVRAFAPWTVSGVTVGDYRGQVLEHGEWRST